MRTIQTIWKKLCRIVPIIIVLGSTILPMMAAADDFRPLTVSIKPNTSVRSMAHIYTVETKIPNDRRFTTEPQVHLNADCETVAQRSRTLFDQSLLKADTLSCAKPLSGNTLALDFSGNNPGITTLVSLVLNDGTTYSTALAPDQRAWIIPAAADNTNVAKQYFSLGFSHLLTGYDHLLFVACLLFICAGRLAKLFATVTAFTAAHSVSLALNALGYVVLNTRAVEAVIALSIVYLAYDVALHLRAQNKHDRRASGLSLSYRHPATVAAIFGLLHGLGFANILNEFGLPKAEQLLALLMFNLGIEAGQLVFIAILLCVFAAASKLIKWRDLRPLKMLGIYSIGGVAAYWTIARAVG